MQIQKPLKQKINNLNQKIAFFEISKKWCIVGIIVILAIYITFSISELYTTEIGQDYNNVKNRLESWNFYQIFYTPDLHIRYALLTFSSQIFGNGRILPFVASIGLLLTTFAFTLQITQKRLSGLVAMAILAQSNLFLAFDTKMTYENFWILFYLLSIYLIPTKIWYLSPILFICGILSKPLVIVFLPATFYLLFKSNIPKFNKSSLITSYIVFAVISSILYVSGYNITRLGFKFDLTSLLDGLTDWWVFLFLTDRFIVLTIPSLMISLAVCSHKHHQYASVILILIVSMIATSSLLVGFTNMTNQPYRFIPLVVFFACGTGILLQNSCCQSSTNTQYTQYK